MPNGGTSGPADEKKMNHARRHHNSPGENRRDEQIGVLGARLGLDRSASSLDVMARVLRLPGRTQSTQSRARMKRAFKYDVAITAADFDALAMAELKHRLEPRLGKGVFTATRGDEPQTPAAQAALRKTIEKDARVVVLRTSEGQRIVLPKDDIDTMNVTGISLMPEGLLTGMSDQEVRDLFAYLRSGQPLNERK